MANPTKLDFPILDYKDGEPCHWKKINLDSLSDAIESWKEGRKLTVKEYAYFKAYCVYYIMAPCWDIPEIYNLRLDVMTMTTEKQLESWLNRALEVGINPISR